FNIKDNMKNFAMAQALSLLARSNDQFSFITYKPKTITSNMKHIGINLGKNEKEVLKSIDRLAVTAKSSPSIKIRETGEEDSERSMQSYPIRGLGDLAKHNLLSGGMLLGVNPSETFTVNFNGILNFQIDGFYDMVTSIWEQETKGNHAMEIWQNKIWVLVANGKHRKQRIYSLEDDTAASIIDKEELKKLICYYEYRHIYLLNVSFKIITKVLTNRICKAYDKVKNVKLLLTAFEQIELFCYGIAKDCENNAFE
ncbi:hypothetical protein ACJX0J_039767, partial [Zea mays]